MKKILLSLIIIAASLNAMATDYAVATLTLKGNTSLEQGEVTLAKTDDPAASSYCAPLYINQYHVVMYALNGSEKYQIWANANLTNLPLGFKTYSDENYTITVSNVSGSETLILRDLSNNEEYPLVNNAVIEFSAAANSTIEDRFVINYQAPAPQPTCTTVRNNLVANRYYTICLDRAIESANGASFWSMQYRNAEGSLAYLVEEQFPLVAGRPYIFQAEAEELCVELSGNPVNGPSYYGALKGTFAAMDQDDLSEASELAADSKIYLLFNNELWRVDYQNNNSLAANRAYVVYDWFEVSEPNAAPGRRVRAIPMQTNGATAFENVDVEAAKAVKFMEDGKIFIKRGDAIYNLQGQLVK